MAQRYGRNQRRAHLARIAELQQALEGGWLQPKKEWGEVPAIDPRTVIESLDHFTRDEGFRMRTAQVTIFDPGSTLGFWEAFRIGGWARWGYAAWRIKNARVQEANGQVLIVLDLETVRAGRGR
jgi:hypothetical protein